MFTKQDIANHLKNLSLRFHMVLILSFSAFFAWLCTFTLLYFGINSILVRYSASLFAGYLGFILGIWVWLLTKPFYRIRNQDSSDVTDFDLIDLPAPRSGAGHISDLFKGKGGSFDGGGASASWAAASSNQSFASPTPAIIDTDFDLPDFDLPSDGDSLPIVLALLVLAIVFFALTGSALFLIWNSSSIFFTISLGAAHSSGLLKQHNPHGWFVATINKTYKPFLLIFAVVIGFGFIAATFFPDFVRLSDFYPLFAKLF